ncbi:MAG TPA: erythromycin esterase family protein, partial [Vicinamibacteria bacterium]|nr:erythromycin esterase family protein [Vicinamibacteria bacterium]
AALTAMGPWPWDTEEVLAVVEWMRHYNADAAHPRKLRFYGFDRHRPSIDPLAPPPFDALLPWNGAERDETMAEHVRLILEHQPEGTRMVLWAHNDHVSREQGGLQPMGAYLAEWLGRGYRAFGFAFARGGFRAIDWSRGPGRPGTVCAPTVGPPPPGTVEAALLRAGLPLLALDLWPGGGPALPRWLSAPRRMRETGVVFAGEEAMGRTLVLPNAYDALFFVEQTAPARPLLPARLATKTH